MCSNANKSLSFSLVDIQSLTTNDDHYRGCSDCTTGPMIGLLLIFGSFHCHRSGVLWDNHAAHLPHIRIHYNTKRKELKVTAKHSQHVTSSLDHFRFRHIGGSSHVSTSNNVLLETLRK